VILTNTFGANRIRLAENGLADRVTQINRRGVEISRDAADDPVAVFASIGPSGKLLLSGEVTAEDLSAAFSEQARALAEASADALVVETISDLEEGRIAVTAACQTGLPVVASAVFDSGKHKDRTMMGSTPEQAAEIFTAAGAEVIGANCGQGIAGFAAICKRLRAATDRPIWIKANAGLPKLVDGRAVYETKAEEFASHVPELVQLGASFIGGCCGTNPDFIRAIARALHNQPAA
jgi:methionine synthase I (cobalamin-dependent)